MLVTMSGSMKQTVVTGGCGFVGSQIVRQLLDRGAAVRVLALPGEETTNIEGLDVELVRGNVLDTDVCSSLVAGADTVFHTAAIYRTWMPDPTLMYDVNIRGTYNVLEASRRAEVDRVVYTASIASLGNQRPQDISNEQASYDLWDVDFAYSRAKYLSREAAEDFSRWGMDVRIVCPAVVLGPGDIGPTPSGKLIINALGDSPPFYVGGGTSYVDVRDAASCHVLAAEKGKAGERYLASAGGMLTRDFLRMVCRVGERKRRLYQIPDTLARAYVARLEQKARKTGEEPMISASALEYNFKFGNFSGEKAQRELGLTYRPMEETLRDAIEYFRTRGWIAR